MDVDCLHPIRKLLPRPNRLSSKKMDYPLLLMNLETKDDVNYRYFSFLALFFDFKKKTYVAHKLVEERAHKHKPLYRDRNSIGHRGP